MTSDDKNILFECFESFLGTISAARTVKAYDEAWAVFLEKDEIDARYNRFPLVFMIFDEAVSSFWFRLYLNLEKEEIYVFYDRPSNTKLYFKDRELLDSCMAVLPFSNAKEKLLEFLSGSFIARLELYYKDTAYSLDRARYISAAIKGSEAEPIFRLLDAEAILEKKMLLLPHELLKSTRTVKELNEKSFCVGELITADIKLFENQLGRFFYLACGNYILPVSEERLLSFIYKIVSRKIVYFLEE